ncbi:hypothetical protein BDV12DRAFT_175129 [Aspergillus spectabilis]
MGQGVLSKAGYAVVDDSKSMLFDGKGFVAPRGPGERFDCYLFCFGRDYKDAIKMLYAISGKQPIVPRYVLGNWWSRYYAYHQDEYVELMDKFASNLIPLSVAVLDMDWHLVSDDRVPHAGWTGYTWNEMLFPDPKRFREELHERNLQITLNDHPHGGIHAFESAYEEMAKFLGHDTTDKNAILFDPTSPKFMEAYFGILHRKLENDACDFWWVDWQQGPYSKIPGFDPLWLLNHFQYLDSGRDGRTPLIFSRYGGPGSHRYPIGFSGDTVVSWDSLAFQPEFTATASNIGYGWWSHDIGGHIRGIRDDELLTRWTQLGVFSPIMRLHSTSSRWMSKEPWLYRKECQNSMTWFLQFRHRLIPYLYSQSVLGHRNDEPLIQPMYWSYPYNNLAYQVPNQYFLGSELLIAPIVQPRDKRTALASVKAWLPPRGRFIDLITNTIYDGNRGITFYRSIDRYPVLAAEGSIIPMDGDGIRTGTHNPTVLDIFVVVGNDGSTSVIESTKDDTFEPIASDTEPQLAESTLTYTQAEGKLTIRSSRIRQWAFRFSGITSIPKGLKVTVNGVDRTVNSIVAVDGDGQPQPHLYVWSPYLLRQDDDGDAYVITIELGVDPQLAVRDHTGTLEELIRGFQIEFAMKDKLWAAIEGWRERPLNAISSLLALGLDEAVVGPLIELVSADSRALTSEAVRR